MSALDDPQNKPPSQPTIAWRPEDLPAASEDPLVGTLLRDKWRVLERVGAGSFGTVYKVQDVKGGWIEALKILGVGRLTGAEAENLRARFLREARIMKRLGTQSSHIVGLSTYEEDIEAGLIYFTMELVEGRSLAAVLQEEGPFDVERTVRIGLQVCDALMAAHEGTEPVVHRDLKLENLMLTTDRSGGEMVKVLDFGIAKIVEREADSRLTTAGTLGTPGYAAPEQLRAGEVDARTDLFAFGVILYALLTGRDPWLGNLAHQPTAQIYELMVATDSGRMIPMERPGTEIPPAMVRVVTRLLRRDPAERFQSVRELRDALERVAAGPSTPGAASLRVTSDEPGVSVEVRSGRTTVAEGRTPLAVDDLPAGGYRIVVRDPAFKPLTTTIELARGAAEDVSLVTTRRRRPSRMPSRRVSVVIGGGLVAIALGAVAAYVQPLGRTLSADELRAAVARGSVTSVALTDGGIEGIMTVGPFASPFLTPLSEGNGPEAVDRLRAAGVFVDTSWEVGRLTELAREAQSRTRYFGLRGGDVASYALRLERLDPGNAAAASLLLKVGERMAWDADAALQDGSPARARALVDGCLELVPEHARCLEVAARM